MSGDTRIRWTSKTWNPMTGCVKLSPGCDHCYAFTLAENKRGTPAFPVGFAPMLRAHKLRDPLKWKDPAMIFVNSMSDIHLEARAAVWDRDYIDQIYDVMRQASQHTYQVLTKRPRLMRDYLLGVEGEPVMVVAHPFSTFEVGGREHLGRFELRADGYLARRNLDALPDHIWPGVTIESDRFTWRAKVLRQIPVRTRMISAEPLLGPLPSLDLTGIGWVIVGGESGPGFRTMDHDWARDLRDRCIEAGVPFYFKQSSHYYTERGIELDGQRYEQYPPQAATSAVPRLL